MKTQSPIITALLAHIAAECNAVDVEARYDAFLDDSYSFESVGGPFAFMSPSRVLKEMGPTDYRCGCADWSDSEEWTEIDGDYYEDRDIEAAKQSFAETKEREITDKEGEIDELNRAIETEAGSANASDEDIEDLATLSRELTALQVELTEIEGYSF